MSRRVDSPSASAALSHLGVMALVAALMGVLVAGIALPFAGVMGFSARTVADSIDDLPEELTTEPLAQRTRVLAADGSLLATWYDQNRVNVTLDKVSLIMRKSIVAIEDYRFYQHGALDLKGTLRAFVTNQASSDVVQGGSSITQQMVKQTLINQADGNKAEIAAAQDDTYERKIRELKYAIAFEQNFSKDWILERYLNVSYFGDGAYGVEAAARHYFSKPASRLTLGEAALLAGIVQNPSKFDPTNNVDEARGRRNVVLNRMAQLNVVSRSEARRAARAPIDLDVTAAQNGCVGVNGEFFCDYLYQYLLADPALGRSVEQRRDLLRGGGLTIETTLDPRMQRASDASVRNRVNPTDQAIGGLAMVVPGSGEVRALSQSRPMGANKARGQTYLNYVVPAKYGDANGFQAGSTFKAFTLAAAINQGIPLSTQIPSPPRKVIPGERLRTCDGTLAGGDAWTVGNSTGSGTFDLYEGTQQSVNTFFAELEARTGLCEPVTLAREMGVSVPDTDIVGPFTLGVTNTDPLTMAGAYATFAGRGVFCEPRPVSRILAASGKVLADYPDRCKQVMPAATADAVNDVLRGVQEPGGFGYDNGLGLSQASAAKTGTIDGNKAVWYAGYTPNLATVAMLAGANSLGHWITLNGQTVGGAYISEAFGSTYAGPIWAGAMQVVDDVLPNVDFVAPDPTEVEGQSVTIPSVGGLSTSAASEQLRNAGFQTVIGSSVYSGYSYGTVAYTSPSGGTSFPSGSTVTIYPSAGPAPAPDPEPSGGDGGRGGDNAGNGGGNGGNNGGGNNGRGNGRGRG